VAIEAAEGDRRRRVVALTDQGRSVLAAARPHWRRAQAAFEKHFGTDEAAAMRGLLRSVPHGRGQHAQRPGPAGR
jgi:DNA-binding MarR family transcriptional regulator